jgi:uncharacterized protein
MEFIVIPLLAFLVSALTFFSGFGLGTLLLPAFIAFYPAEIAVGLTAVVHALNNIFKFGLVRRDINWPVVFRFGLPAVLFAYFGARCLFRWPLRSRQFHMSCSPGRLTRLH